MRKVLDINFHGSHFGLTLEQYLEKSKPNTGYAEFLRQHFKIKFIFHANKTGAVEKNGVSYEFKRNIVNSKLWFPFRLIWQIKNYNPDVILIHSLLYIHYAVLLRLCMPSDTIIIIQHHAEKIPGNIFKRFVVKNCSRLIDAFMFASSELGSEWTRRKLISSDKRIYEIMEGSSSFKLKNKIECRAALNLPPQEKIFIWIGRLDENKNPMCVLRAFNKYAGSGAEFKFFLFFHSAALLEEVKTYITEHHLAEKIILKGFAAHTELENWLNAADFIVSASFYEGSGYAICEAMSCGCIPLVTDIPSFRFMTSHGRVGFLYPPGNDEELFCKLLKTEELDIEHLRNIAIDHFNQNLSFRAISDAIRSMIEELTVRKKIHRQTNISYP